MTATPEHKPATLSASARIGLFVAFAFTIMADPVSSVAYAIEAANEALDADLSSLFPTMALVVGLIALIAAGYHTLIARFPRGGGGAQALGAAFGEGWAFLPLGALLVDFTLTIAVSCSAASSAVIAYVPSLAGGRVALGIALVACVGGATLLGHLARKAFAAATIAFVAASLVVLSLGAGADPPPGPAIPLAGDAEFFPVLLAMPLGMALATGVEAPSNAIAQLGQLDDDGRRRFGQWTMWLMLAIVITLTLAFAALAVRLQIGVPEANSTLLADLARTATGGGLGYAAFQAASATLLLAAAASSFFGGSGLLKALAEHGSNDHDGLLPVRFRAVNTAFVPVWGVVALFLIATVLVAAAGGHEQELVHYYAAAVFASFLGALVAGATLAWRDRRILSTLVAVAGATAVAVVLVLNLGRLDPVVSLTASAAISLWLWRSWVRKGRPSGVAKLPA